MNEVNFSSPPQSICLIRLSAIGDVAHVVAVVNRLQQVWPDVKITWIIGKIEYQLVKNMHNIEFIIFDKKNNFESYQRIYNSLKGTYFDAVLMLQAALRASIISVLLSAKYKIGFDKKRSRDAQWLFSNQRISGPDRVHVVDTFFQFLTKLGVPDADKIWNLALDNKATNYADKLVQQPCIVINPNSSVIRRNWTIKGYAQIIDYCANTLNKLVIITGAPSEQEKSFNQAILNQCVASKNILDLTAKTQLQELAAIIKKAELVIAPDTGPAHIATAVNTPVISLFADTNPNRARPYLSEKLVVNAYPEALKEIYQTSEDEQKWGFRVRRDNVMERIKTAHVVQKIGLFFSHNNVIG